MCKARYRHSRDGLTIGHALRAIGHGGRRQRQDIGADINGIVSGAGIAAAVAHGNRKAEGPAHRRRAGDGAGRRVERKPVRQRTGADRIDIAGAGAAAGRDAVAIGDAHRSICERHRIQGDAARSAHAECVRPETGVSGGIGRGDREIIRAWRVRRAAQRSIGRQVYSRRQCPGCNLKSVRRIAADGGDQLVIGLALRPGWDRIGLQRERESLRAGRSNSAERYR